jgi:hypothetical protein
MGETDQPERQRQAEARGVEDADHEASGDQRARHKWHSDEQRISEGIAQRLSAELTADCESRKRSAARVTLRSCMSASRTSSKFRSKIFDIHDIDRKYPNLRFH